MTAMDKCPGMVCSWEEETGTRCPPMECVEEHRASVQQEMPSKPWKRFAAIVLDYNGLECQAATPRGLEQQPFFFRPEHVRMAHTLLRQACEHEQDSVFGCRVCGSVTVVPKPQGPVCDSSDGVTGIHCRVCSTVSETGSGIFVWMRRIPPMPLSDRSMDNERYSDLLRWVSTR